MTPHQPAEKRRRGTTRTGASPFEAYGLRAGAAQRAAQANGQRAQMAMALGESRCEQIASCVEVTRGMRGELMRMIQGVRTARRRA